MKTELASELEQQSARILAELRETKDPVLITEHGAPSAYLVDVDTFEFMQRRVQILEGIARGERAIQDNQTCTHDEAKKRMSKWLN